jgi:UDP:flavonoid glycosyltransferase YjiC (YdhE family)
MHLVMAGASTPSHFYPSLALISELVSRGHRVSYLIGERLAALVAPTGVDVIAHPTVLPDVNAAWPDDAGAAMQVFLDEAIAVLGVLLDRVERPDGGPL